MGSNTNLPDLFKSGALAKWGEAFGDQDRSAIRVTGAQSIGTQGGTFTLGGEDQGDELSLCIVDWANLNIWYEGKWKPGVQRGASCFAVGRADCDGLVPDAELPPYHHECATCPHNEWGSDPEGGRGKACKNIVRLVVAHADDVRNGASPTGVKTYYLNVPVTSVKEFMQLAAVIEDKVPLCVLETTITIESGDTGGHVLHFEPAAPIFEDMGEDEIAFLAALRDGSRDMLFAKPFMEGDENESAKVAPKSGAKRPAKRRAAKGKATRKKGPTRRKGTRAR